MIKSKKELKFYLMADCMMNKGVFKINLKNRIINLLNSDYIMKYLKSMRYLNYYEEKGNKILSILYKIKFNRYGCRCGFSISHKVCGYGLVIPHYGTIVIGGGNAIGNYAVLHTSTCITAGHKIIGNAFYLSTGVKVINDITIADNVSVGANSLVNKTIADDNSMVAGMPAIIRKKTDPWYIRDGCVFEKRYGECEALRVRMGL